MIVKFTAPKGAHMLTVGYFNTRIDRKTGTVDLPSWFWPLLEPLGFSCGDIGEISIEKELQNGDIQHLCYFMHAHDEQIMESVPGPSGRPAPLKHRGMEEVRKRCAELWAERGPPKVTIS